jgi:type VI secretion system protein ImpH
MEKMAAYGWRERRSVADGLFQEGHRFAFLQAVRLLESLYAERTPPAEGVDPDEEIVHFRHAVRLDFPATDVEEIRPGAPGRPAEMTVNVLGLAGALGPMPQAVSELIVECAFRKDTAFRDFLDIFNHRLISLLYRARKKYRPAMDPKTPERGRVANVLYALLGLGTPHLRDRLELSDRALLAYTGLLADRFRSSTGLMRILEDYFGVAVQFVPFQGKWSELADQDATRIGQTGRNQTLGGGAVLGKRIWDEEAGCEIRLGPLSLDAFLGFLPNGRMFHAAVGLVRFQVRGSVDFRFRLTLAAAEVPELRLGRAEGAYLGWTSWLKTKPFANDDSQVQLRTSGAPASSPAPRRKSPALRRPRPRWTP